MKWNRIALALAATALLATACGYSEVQSRPSATTAAPSTTEPTDTTGTDIGSDVTISHVIEAPGGVSITVDGDAADWADVPGTDVALKPITDEPAVPHDAVVKLAHDDTTAYMLFQVNDDLNWNAENGKRSGAAAVEWAIDSGAGQAMGSLDTDRKTSLGLVDLWHWELECATGVVTGGTQAGPGDGTGGNDSGCNFDDEYASQTDVREDDDTASAENSLTGVWTHSASVEDGEGTWTFEISRPMNTGDSQDAQFTAGGSSLLNVAYWDPDRPDGGSEGWDNDYHVVSAMDGWMQVNWGTETGGGQSAAGSDVTISHVIEAPGGVSITVDGDAADWADVPGTDVALKPITDEPAVPHDAVVKLAHDDTTAYMLFQVNDDLNWNAENGKRSGAAAVEWAIDSGAGQAMGSLDTDRKTSLGLVDLWHWELECATGVVTGGTQAGPGDGTGGNDSGCNFDDEYASQTDVREDDDTASAENSLTGVWTHSASVEDGEGTWTFEISRPMNTGDSQDAQFTAGGSSLLNVAYWDPDRPDGGSEGWDNDYHVVSAMDGWMQVNWGTETGGGQSAAEPEVGAIVDAPGGVSITVDGSDSDWGDVSALDVTLKPITGEPALPHDATIKVAHDDTTAYLLFQVQDDLNWNPENAHLSGAAGVEWQVTADAPEHMGAEDGERDVSLGMVDIWHWELDCGAGVLTGGTQAGPGGGTGGNDSGCNFDDEYATSTSVREDDDTASAENSLTGVWTHSASVEDGAGTWTFEISRPMNTGDSQDAQFVAGESSFLATAYWDPDRPDGGSEGWDNDYHVVSAYEGWIQVNWG